MINGATDNVHTLFSARALIGDSPLGKPKQGCSGQQQETPEERETGKGKRQMKLTSVAADLCGDSASSCTWNCASKCNGARLTRHFQGVAIFAICNLDLFTINIKPIQAQFHLS